jgi:predicted DNA-binding antitoxin AbrB/MazE fold protein
MTVRAIYENGIFRPTEPVDLPEKSEVQVVIPAPLTDEGVKLDATYEVLGERYRTGQRNLAERHNEHQP